MSAGGGTVVHAPARSAKSHAAVDSASREREQRAARTYSAPRTGSPLKMIDAFRNNPTYGGDGTRIDLAYAVYALSHCVADADLRAALRSRDLSHKGNEQRQNEYLERTIRKAQALLQNRSTLDR